MGSAAVGSIAVAPSDRQRRSMPAPARPRSGSTSPTATASTSPTDAGRTLAQCRAEEQQVHRPHLHPSAPIPTSSMSRRWATSSGPTRSAASIARGTAARSWEKVLHRNDVAGAIDLSMDRANPRILFASIWEARRNFWNISSGGPGSGLFRSTDGGDTLGGDLAQSRPARRPARQDRRGGLAGARRPRVGAGRGRGRQDRPLPLRRLRRALDPGLGQPRPDAPALVLHPRLRRHRPRRHGLCHQPADVEVDRRRRDASARSRPATATTTICGSTPTIPAA